MKERFFVVGRVNKVVCMVSLAVLLTLCPSLQAQFVVSTNNGAITIEKYTGTGCDVVIPSAINGMPVTTIGSSACTNLNVTSITIPNSVTEIGGHAFYLLPSLTSITIPPSVTNIGDFAFAWCSGITNVVMSPNITKIGDGTFAGCSNLTEVIIPNGVTSIGREAFASTKLMKVTIPNGVTSIGMGAFAGTKLTTITIPASVTNLGTGVVGGCRELIAISVDSQNPAYSSVDGVLLNKAQTLLIAYPPGKPEDYIIPNGVTTITSEAFSSCALTSVFVPSTVTNMGRFQYCANLTNITVDSANPVYSSVDGMLLSKDQKRLIQCPCGKIGEVKIPNSVTEVGYNALSGCNMTRIWIPASVIEMRGLDFGASSFWVGTNLTAFTVDSANRVYSSVDGLLLDKTRTSILYCPAGKVGSVTIPEGVESIEPFAFGWCNIQEISIPSSVTRIAEGAFEQCFQLTSVSIRSSYVDIGTCAFEYCMNLQGVYFTGDAPTVSASAFYRSNPTIYYVPGTTGWGSTLAGRPTALWVDSPTEGQFVFVTNGNTLTITGYKGPGGELAIPSTINGLPVTKLGERAFEYCTNLTRVSIPNGVTEIGKWAFEFCPCLLSVDIPSSVTNIEDYAFGLCFGLTNVVMPPDITKIGAGTFSGCSNLTQFTISSGVTSIGAYAFAGTKLTTITIPRSVTNMGASAFVTCSNLTAINVDWQNPAYSSVDGLLLNKSQTLLIACPPGKTGNVAIPDGVCEILSFAFSYCRLNSVTIPNSVTNLGYSTFMFSGLTNISIPSSVTMIGDQMFCGCVNLTQVTIPNSVTNIGNKVFQDSGLTSITIPGSVAETGYYLFLNCVKLTNVVILEGVTKLPNDVFENCTKLTSIEIPESVSGMGIPAFYGCTNLKSVFLKGNAPTKVPVFPGNSIIYYLPGTTGWGSTFAGRPTELWRPNLQPTRSFESNKAGFKIKWAPGIPFVVEVCTNLSDPNWVPHSTNTLSGSEGHFIDSESSNATARFYRIRVP